MSLYQPNKTGPVTDNNRNSSVAFWWCGGVAVSDKEAEC